MTVAPARSSTWQPTDADEGDGPGTAQTPRPSALPTPRVGRAATGTGLDDNGCSDSAATSRVFGSEIVPLWPKTGGTR